jgi:hypothetical protein
MSALARQEALAHIYRVAQEALGLPSEVPQGAEGRDVAFRLLETHSAALQSICRWAGDALAGEFPAEYEIERVRRIAHALIDALQVAEDDWSEEHSATALDDLAHREQNMTDATRRHRLVSIPGATWDEEF